MTSDRPLLVVTATLGRSPWLCRTVLSVAAYAGPHATHVLVAPPETLGALRRSYPGCTVVPDTVSRGVYPAINLGIAHGAKQSWKWFTWINDDDEFTPGFAHHLSRTLRHDGNSLEAPWSYGQIQLTNCDAHDLGRLAVARSPSSIVSLAQVGVNPLNQQGMLAPRAWVEKCGPLREDLLICADVDFWLKAAVAGAKFQCSPEIVALFRLHEGQISGDVTRHRAEFRKVVQGVAGVSRDKIVRWAALTRFRLDNVGVYANRIHRCGLKGGFAMLEQPVRKPS
jgi:GT2 family glycosyltransferase